MSEFSTLAERFVGVAEARTLQLASENLNISQPALTQSIKKIEAIFESQLFERTKKGMLLTVAGQLLYERSQEMLRQEKIARLEIDDALHGGAGTLRIAAGTAWGYCFLPSILRDLQSEFEGLKIELDIVLTPQALPKLVNGEVDIVLGAVEEDFLSSETFETRELVKLQFAAGCGPNSALASKPVVSVAELAESPIVLYQDDEQLISEVIRAIEERAGCEFNIALKTKSLLAALEMVSTGDYVVFLARPLLDKIPGMGIKVIHLDRELYTFQTAAYFRKSLLRTRHFQKLLADVQKVDVFYQGKPDPD